MSKITLKKLRRAKKILNSLPVKSDYVYVEGKIIKLGKQ